MSVWFGAYSTNNWWSHCCIFMRKRMNSSEGDVLIRIPHSWEGFWEKQRGESADNNSGIVGYYFGSLAQTESSCCPAAEPKQPRPPAERRREKQCVCLCVCVCCSKPPSGFWIHSKLLVQELLERGERESEGRRLNLSPACSDQPYEQCHLSLSLTFYFSLRRFALSHQKQPALFFLLSHICEDWRPLKEKRGGWWWGGGGGGGVVCGKRKKEKEREAERGGKESMRDREPGSSGAQQRGLCASARPSRAQRRVEDEGGERRQGGGGGGPTGKGPGLGPVAGAYIPQNRLHIDLGLGSHEETPSTPPPSNPFLLHSPPPQLSRGQLWISNYTSTGAVCLRLPPWTQKYWDGRKKQQRGSEWGAKTCGDFCS